MSRTSLRGSLFLIPVICAVLTGCSNDGIYTPTQRRAAPDPPRLEPLASSNRTGTEVPLDFEVLQHYTTGPFAEPATLIFFSPEDWTRAMEAIREDDGFIVLPPPPVPDGVDWKTECVILCTIGRKKTSPASVGIDTITRHGRTATVHVDIRPRGRYETPDSPYEIVKLARKGLSDVDLAVDEFSVP